MKNFKSRSRSKRFFYWQNKFKDIGNTVNNSKTWSNANEMEIRPPTPQITGNTWYNNFFKLHTQTNDKNEQTNLILEAPNLINFTNDISHLVKKSLIKLLKI